VIEAEGWPAAVLLGTLVAGLGAAIAVARRDALRPQPAT
jgi:hypothetical protein